MRTLGVFGLCLALICCQSHLAAGRLRAEPFWLLSMVCECLLFCRSYSGLWTLLPRCRKQTSERFIYAESTRFVSHIRENGSCTSRNADSRRFRPVPGIDLLPIPSRPSGGCGQSLAETSSVPGPFGFHLWFVNVCCFVVLIPDFVASV